MKKLITILSVAALVMVAMVGLLSGYAIRRAETERNKERTQRARDARWKQNGQAVMEPNKETSDHEKNQ